MIKKEKTYFDRAINNHADALGALSERLSRVERAQRVRWYSNELNRELAFILVGSCVSILAVVGVLHLCGVK